MFLEKADKKPDDKNGYQEGHHSAQGQQGNVVFCQDVGMLLMHVPEALDRCGYHGGYGKKKREFSRGLTGQTLAQAADDGGAGTAEPGQHDRNDLETADLEC